jgi:hypothetical protein
MKMLEHQLADYGNRQQELHGPISAEELTVRVGGIDQTAPVQPFHPMPQPAKLRRPQGWLVAVGAAAAVFVLLGATTLLFRVTREGSPVATSPPIDALSSLTWSRVPYDEVGFGPGLEQGMASVTVGGPGLVAVGGAGPGEDREWRAAVWTSPDGITWSRVPHNEALFGRAIMNSITVGGPGLVAVGTATLDNDDDVAAVWTSPDGITWSRVPYNEAVFRGATMQSVTVGGPGLVAVGWDGHPHGGTSNAVVWTSVDGITWSRVPYNEAVFGRDDGQWMWSVATGGPGLVAVGFDSSGAAVWTSIDGIDWSRVPRNEAVFGVGEMRSVTAGGPGLVAVGAPHGASSHAVVWTSVDGISWSRVPHNEAVFGEAAMTSVTVAGPGLVAVGGTGNLRLGQAQVWTSPDGIAWSRVNNEAVFSGRRDIAMRSVTAGGPGLVVVGADGIDAGFVGNYDAVVWVAEPGE